MPQATITMQQLLVLNGAMLFATSWRHGCVFLRFHCFLLHLIFFCVKQKGSVEHATDLSNKIGGGDSALARLGFLSLLSIFLSHF